MAIIQEEYICVNGVILTYTHSDNNKKIRQIETGIIYDEAYDVPNRYTYEETDIDIESVENEQSDNV